MARSRTQHSPIRRSRRAQIARLATPTHARANSARSNGLVGPSAGPVKNAGAKTTKYSPISRAIPSASIYSYQDDLWDKGLGARNDITSLMMQIGTRLTMKNKIQGNYLPEVETSLPIANVYTKAFKAALVRAGIEDFHWHDLRHTFATWHRQAGTPTHELQRLGGWLTVAMVERYAHLAPEALQGAANRLDVFGGYATATPN